MRATLVILASLALNLLASVAGHTQDQSQRPCTVSRISDGDTFRCSDGRRVRLAGIDTPELSQQPFGGRSREILSQWLPPGSTVALEVDVAPTDRYGRQLAYVWSGSTMINEVMVRSGWAVPYTVPPNVKYAERLSHAQKEARASGAGFWAQHGFDCLPSEFRRHRCASPP